MSTGFLGPEGRTVPECRLWFLAKLRLMLLFLFLSIILSSLLSPLFVFLFGVVCVWVLLWDVLLLNRWVLWSGALSVSAGSRSRG